MRRSLVQQCPLVHAFKSSVNWMFFWIWCSGKDTTFIVYLKSWRSKKNNKLSSNICLDGSRWLSKHNGAMENNLCRSQPLPHNYQMNGESTRNSSASLQEASARRFQCRWPAWQLTFLAPAAPLCLCNSLQMWRPGAEMSPMEKRHRFYYLSFVHGGINYDTRLDSASLLCLQIEYIHSCWWKSSFVLLSWV